MLSRILGAVRISSESKLFVNYLVKSNIQCCDIKITDGKAAATIDLFSYFKADRVLRKAGIEYEICEKIGLPCVIYRYRKRWGIFLGLLIFCITFFLSGAYIWSVDVSGNINADEEEIIELLDKLGCGVGDKISEIDFDMLHNDFLLKCEDIAWISVNMDGTRANVEVREKKNVSDEDGGIYNIIAAEDGMVDLVSVVKGKPQIVIGETVRKGELLISGVSSYREGEKNYYEGAKGKVFATVNRRFSVEAPCNVNVSEYTGNVVKENTVNFFGFSVNLFPNCRIQYAECDTIIENRQIVLFNCVELPIWIHTAEHKEYSVKASVITKEEARVCAVSKYKTKLAEITKDSQLLSISTKHSFENGVYKIDCSLYCIADIARSVPFTIDDESQENLNGSKKDQRSE